MTFLLRQVQHFNCFRQRLNIPTRTSEAFGATTASTGTRSGTFGYAGAFGYQEDSDSGLKLLGNRYYDSSLGRFISRDPIKDGNNWYSYCGGNPVSFADPNGLFITSVNKPEEALVLEGCLEDAAEVGGTRIGPELTKGVIVATVAATAVAVIEQEVNPDTSQRTRRGKLIQIYRVFSANGENPMCDWWSFEDPRADPVGFARRHALPPPGYDGRHGNDGDRYIVGTWDRNGAEIREVVAIGGYPKSGGAGTSEIVFHGNAGAHVIPIDGGKLCPPAIQTK